MDDPHALTEKFWKSLAKSPFVMLQLADDAGSAAPMSAQLDRAAHGAIWFFTSRGGGFARLGPAAFTFAARDHDLFARGEGTLVEETSRAVRDRLWSRPVAAWFPEGKDSPDLLLLRMELGEAKIWDAQLGLLGVLKLLAGADVRREAAGHAATVTL